MIRNAYNYKLKYPIKYAFKGDEVDGKSLQLIAPKNQELHARCCMKMEQLFYRAQKSMIDLYQNIPQSTTQAQSVDPDQSLDAEGICQLLMMSDIDYFDVVKLFKEIAMSGCCKVDDKLDITTGIWESLNLEDVKLVTAEYMRCFLLTSLSSKIKKS